MFTINQTHKEQPFRTLAPNSNIVLFAGTISKCLVRILNIIKLCKIKME